MTNAQQKINTVAIHLRIFLEFFTIALKTLVPFHLGMYFTTSESNSQSVKLVIFTF
jgi:hypothetical protein